MNAVAPISGAQAGKKPNRWLWIALILSLAVNLLVLGTMAGAAWKFHRAPSDGRFGPNLIGFSMTLPDARRQELWRATSNERHALKPLRVGVREARQHARTLLITEPFDQQRFNEAQTRVLDAEMKMRAGAQKLFVSIAGLLTPAERAAYAKWQPSELDRRRRVGPEGEANDSPPAR